MQGAGIITSALGGYTDTGLETTEGRAANAVAQVGGSQLAGRALSLPVALTDLAVSSVMQSPIGESMGNRTQFETRRLEVHFQYHRYHLSSGGYYNGRNGWRSTLP